MRSPVAKAKSPVLPKPALTSVADKLIPPQVAAPLPDDDSDGPDVDVKESVRDLYGSQVLLSSSEEEEEDDDEEEEEGSDEEHDFTADAANKKRARDLKAAKKAELIAPKKKAKKTLKAKEKKEKKVKAGKPKKPKKLGKKALKALAAQTTSADQSKARSPFMHDNFFFQVR